MAEDRQVNSGKLNSNMQGEFTLRKRSHFLEKRREGAARGWHRRTVLAASPKPPPRRRTRCLRFVYVLADSRLALQMQTTGKTTATEAAAGAARPKSSTVRAAALSRRATRAAPGATVTGATGASRRSNFTSRRCRTVANPPPALRRWTYP
jgi:hypothetical protein